VIDHHGPAFSFWLHYLDSRGGLWERSGDAVLAVLPDRLGATHDLPETALITDDPDISREDGVLFLGAGHPAIDQAADAVITDGDIGTLTVTYRSRPLATEDLLAKIRDQVPVDHGRIDATGSPIQSQRALLRLGVLVSHTVSAEEQFTEVAECIVDVASRIAWTEDAATRLRGALTTADPTTNDAPRRPANKNPLLHALVAAHQELDAAATRRGQELASDADTERTAEITRAGEYYAAALTALDKRRVGADSRRQELLDSRTAATRAERDRRLAEINEKYRHHHELRPYRLHLINIPVLRLATDVRRGERRWPLVFDYLPLLGTVAPTRCPHCDAPAPLVATKTQLGCTTCVPIRTTTPTPPTPKPAPTPQPTPTKNPAPSVPQPTTRPVQPAAVAPRKTPTGPFLPGKPEQKKVTDFWNQVAAGEHRKLARLIAPDSPLAALTRLYGALGPLYGIGMPVGHAPDRFTSGNYNQPVAGGRGGTAGSLYTRHDEYRYLLLWSPDRLLEEIYPYSIPWHLGRGASALLRGTTEAPEPHVDLDMVAKLLLTRTTARYGLTFTARALAAWWRLPDPDDLLARFGPRVLAATLDRAIRYWSGAGQATYPEAADAFRVDEDLMRKATPLLQKRLEINAACPW
jgi:hypothetical protein